MAADEVRRLFEAIPGTSRFAGEHHGRDQVLALLSELTSTTGMTTTVDAVYDGPEAAIVHQRGIAGDYRDEALVRFEVHDGRVTDITEFLFDVAAFDAFAAQLPASPA